MFYIVPEKAQELHLSFYVYGFHVQKTLKDKSAYFPFFSVCYEFFHFSLSQ